MPGLYKNNDFDIAGFSVGVVERENLLKKENVKKEFNNWFRVNGIHSNGFSMVRKYLKQIKYHLMKSYLLILKKSWR